MLAHANAISTGCAAVAGDARRRAVARSLFTAYGGARQNLRRCGCIPIRPVRQGPVTCAQSPAAPAPAAEGAAAVLTGTKAGSVVQLYRYPFMGKTQVATLLHKAQSRVSESITSIDTEMRFNIELAEPLTAREADTLQWLLRETFDPEGLSPQSFLARGRQAQGARVVEVGPRLSFSTAWATNAISICSQVGLTKVRRIEMSRRYLVAGLAEEAVAAFAAMVHDRMTEQLYTETLRSFRVDKKPEPVFTVPVLAKGRAALEEINRRMGLAFDDWDLDYYTRMFREDMKRDPTNVELFDIAQSNSEHSRHWFFRGNLFREDGTQYPKKLFDIVKAPWKANPNNSVVAFKDNSSTIRGFKAAPIVPAEPGTTSRMELQERDLDLLLTAETHNFPCAVAPYPGAETGAGGRIRDTHATGRGSLVVAATAGYCVGNLHIPGYPQPWEDPSFAYPATLASPLQILIDASNGASDYGNKFGEPLIAGYTRSFGARLPGGERREWLKPIMFSGGVGTMDHTHAEKHEGQLGMLVVKIGGPAYRIGMGGGAASSVPSGSQDAELDFNAVQRGDAEMAQKLWRVVRACVEMGGRNPIVQIHDQGAGGNCNVVKEIIYPLGAKIDIRKVKLGDDTMSVLEIWGAEYQENDCVLIKPEDEGLLQRVCERERCNMQVIGSIDGSGRVTLVDAQAPPDSPAPVDLDLDKVLGKMPDKDFKFKNFATQSGPLSLPSETAAGAALERVLRLTDVCSKRFLTSKVDRSVTGLVAQQQCVGPLLLPLSDFALVATSHQDTTGLATSIGEQPYKGLIDPAAMARLAVGEAVTNLAMCKITALADVRASVNWMHAAKMGCEGAAMYESAEAMAEAMIELGMACDGGKDSLSMAAVADKEVVKAPGQLVISAYAPCPDITVKVTPDIKRPGNSSLVHVDLGRGRRRLGGSALAHVFAQVGNVSPDVKVSDLKAGFEVTQRLLADGKLLAGHDVSDGGIVVTALEMAFASNSGLDVDLPAPSDPADAKFGPLAALFAEELGWVLEVASADADAVVKAYRDAGVEARVVGKTLAGGDVTFKVGGAVQVQGPVTKLRQSWEETAFELEKLQCAEECVESERACQETRVAHTWRTSFTPAFTSPQVLETAKSHRVAVIREEGSNGDREMAAVLRASGLEPWDVHMSDLLSGKATLDGFSGIVFVGGFSYADVLDSAKGWAGSIRLNPSLAAQFEAFYARPDTFSLGVCNGCQLMALLGWVPGLVAGGQRPAEVHQPRFVHNRSGRFEFRFTQVSIDASPAIHLRGMEGSSLGVWLAHGEGQALFPDPAVLETVRRDKLAPIRYVDPTGKQTEQYPFNPNGSPEGIAALCSPCGRHLALMPHPERCFLGWQLPYLEGTGFSAKGPGPWLKLFQNMRSWLNEVRAE